MKEFNYIDDIDDWLEPMNYQEFWSIIGLLDLELVDKDICDQEIESGATDPQKVLTFLKGLARVDLADRFQLDWKPVTPWLKLVE